MISEPSFFIGYLPAARDVRRRALVASLFACLCAALLAAVLGVTPIDIGSSQYGDALQISGVFRARPYPLVSAPPDAGHPLGRTIVLGGDGKRGAQDLGAGLDGQSVVASGEIVKRGTIEMLLVGGEDALRRAPTKTVVAAAQPLGRWRVTGEICDGKCAAGAMRPGTGLAHKACANLCIAGGLPPVLVSASPVAGRSFLLLSDADGEPGPDLIADFVGVPVVLEGEIEQNGDLLIFHVDWPKAKRS